MQRVVRVAFDLELEQVRLRALRAHAAVTQRRDDVTALDARLASVARALADAADRDRGLAARFGLQPDELAVTWAVVAASHDPSLAVHLGDLGPRSGRLGISLAQAGQLLELEPSRARAVALAFAGGHPLVECGLIEPVDDLPMTAVTALIAAPRLVMHLAGDDRLDPELAHAGAMVEPPATVISDGERDALVSRLRQLLHTPTPPPAIVLEGRRGVGRRTIAREAAGPVAALDLDRVARSSRALERALAALQRECILRDATPLLASVDDVAGDDPDAQARRYQLLSFIERSARTVVLTATRPVAIETSRPAVRLAVELPAPATRAALLRHALGDVSPALESTITSAALRFRLGPSAIFAAARSAWGFAAARGEPPAPRDLGDGVAAVVADRMGTLARPLRSKLTWDDLVLPDDTRAQLHLLLTRVRHAYRVLEDWGYQRHLPGSGVAALFSGPPGTGKTMVAGILARELGLELYRVDLSQITSKWVGETEKQLDQVFAAADVGHVVLLFDEADALFAKRTEVKGATERYANMEVNFLLQRIESFGGVAILTTNMDGSLDPALRRRLGAHIQFPAPDEDERATLWRRLVPKQAPLGRDVDAAALARDYPGFAGAHIRNALTTAAFLAAEAGTPITQAVLRRAADEEARAMGRMVRGGMS